MPSYMRCLQGEKKINRREFLKTVGMPVLMAGTIIAASGFSDYTQAWKRKGKSSSGNGQGNRSSSVGDKSSNVSSLDLGSTRLKTNQGSKKR